ncbi:NADH-cytochrome b5 reductase 2 [Diplonema papillatum]|nr:NADH-cytochrome b5 reductase 2 [Diplonema papillatum]
MFRKIGVCAAGAAMTYGASCAFASQPAGAPAAFSPKEFKEFPLLAKKQVSHDSQLLTFGLPSKDHVMGMTVASCVVTKFTDSKGEDVIRPYTPVSRVGDKGTFDLLVKKYPNGKMGTHLHDLKEGESIALKGPFKKIQINSNEHPAIGMVAGGTGITPMYQVVRHLLDDPTDKTQLSLIFANRSEADILMKAELDDMLAKYDRLKVFYVLDSASSSWNGGVGHINAQMLTQNLPAPGKGKVLVCGPPGMMKHVSGDKDTTKQPPTQGDVTGLLKELGYTSDDVYKM